MLSVPAMAFALASIYAALIRRPSALIAGTIILAFLSIPAIFAGYSFLGH
jgi:hypothetical protein